VTHGGRTRFWRLYLHVFACAACVLPVASYVLSTFGWDPADIGVGTALVGVAGTVAAPAWGWLDDRRPWAPRAAMAAAAVAATAAAASLGRCAHAVTWAALAAFGAAEGPLDAFLTTRILASGAHGRRLGRIRAFGSVGWVVGLALAATVLTLWPGHGEWVLLTAAVLAITAPRSWGRRTRPRADAGRPHSAHGPLPLRPVLRVLAVTFPTSVAMSSVVQFTAGWAHQELSAGPFLALAPIALSAALELPAFPWVDRLASRHPARVLAMLAGPPLAVATGALALAPSRATMLGAQPLVAVSFALWFVGQSRLLAEAVPAHRQASGQTLGAALSSGAGSLLAGVLGGQLAERFGYAALFAALAALSLTGVAFGLLRSLRGLRYVDHLKRKFPVKRAADAPEGAARMASSEEGASSE
jgi:PPP family 3-phenylpropionic acid transporter